MSTKVNSNLSSFINFNWLILSYCVLISNIIYLISDSFILYGNFRFNLQNNNETYLLLTSSISLLREDLNN
jgi:hypothetical protein